MKNILLIERKKERTNPLTDINRRRENAGEDDCNGSRAIGSDSAGCEGKRGLGVFGVEQEYPEFSLIIPKKPRGKGLSLIDLESNREKSRGRIIEDAIGVVKRPEQ